MRHVETKLLKSFVAIADNLSFTRAAEKLRLSQPALSLQLRKLETQVGRKLFERSSSHVELTIDGERLLDAAREVVRASESLWSCVQKLETEGQRLKLGSAIYCSKVPERVAFMNGFASSQPDIALTVESGWQPDLLAALERRSLTAALIFGVQVPRSYFDNEREAGHARESIYPDDLDCIILKRRRLGLLVPREWDIASAREISLSALSGTQIAVPRPNACPPLYKPLFKLIAEAGGSIVTPPDYHAAAVEQYGVERRIMALSFGWYDNLREGDDVVCLPIEGFGASTEMAVITHPNDHSHLKQAIMDYAETFRDAEWERASINSHP